MLIFWLYNGNHQFQFFRDFLLDEKKNTKIFHAKLLLWAQYHWVLSSMK